MFTFQKFQCWKQMVLQGWKFYISNSMVSSIYGVIVSKFALWIIMFHNCNTPCDPMQGINLFNNWLGSPMFGWSILKTFIACLQIMPCAVRGQLHYGHSEIWACIIHTFPRWLVDATNAMSFPFGHNKTFVFVISQARNRALTIMPSSFFIFHIIEDFALHPY